MKVDVDLIANNLAGFDEDSDAEFEEKFLAKADSLESTASGVFAKQTAEKTVKSEKARSKEKRSGKESSEQAAKKRPIQPRNNKASADSAPKNVVAELEAFVAKSQAKQKRLRPQTDFKALAYAAYSEQFSHLPSKAQAEAIQAEESADLQAQAELAREAAGDFISLFEKSEPITAELPDYFYNEEEFDELWRYWRERGMNFLVRREHSITELTQKLLQRQCPSFLIDFLIGWYLEQNYLSLERFAYSYAKNRADLGYGPIRVRYELNQHEVPGRYITQAFKEIDWGAARERAERKIRQSDPQKRRQALFRRGFKSEGAIW